MTFEPLNADDLTTWLGVHWDGAQTLRLTIRPDLLNPVGFLSGVAAFTLVDYSMASALLEHMSATSAARRSTSPSTTCAPPTRATSSARRPSTAAPAPTRRSEVVHESGDVLATAVGTYAIFPAR